MFILRSVPRNCFRRNASYSDQCDICAACPGRKQLPTPEGRWPRRSNIYEEATAQMIARGITGESVGQCKQYQQGKGKHPKRERRSKHCGRKHKSKFKSAAHANETWIERKRIITEGTETTKNYGKMQDTHGEKRFD